MESNYRVAGRATENMLLLETDPIAVAGLVVAIIGVLIAIPAACIYCNTCGRTVSIASARVTHIKEQHPTLWAEVLQNVAARPQTTMCIV